IEANLRSPHLVAYSLITVAFLMFAVEWFYRRMPSRKEGANLLDVLLIGAAQTLALVPGVSRSGVTILTGMGRGLKRERSAHFSFLISVPIVLGAG
ncbi:undecaprenyl-diphosphatase, partial [Candidatus Saccharibacteria bacterium]|nr:undecaprenyl-diphosphatase [Candidatus Saccharibacteria bacterium]